jgi:hypothetical protein
VVLSELITVIGPWAVVKVKMLPLILVRVPLVRWRCVDVGDVAGVGLGVEVDVAAGAQEDTTISNMTTSKVTDHMNRCFIDIPPNYCSSYFPRKDYLLSFGFSHSTDNVSSDIPGIRPLSISEIKNLL